MWETTGLPQAFAKSHPELGEIEGRTKAIFLENLQRAWAQRGSGLGWVVQTPAVPKAFSYCSYNRSDCYAVFCLLVPCAVPICRR